MEDKSVSSLVSEPKEHEFIITYFFVKLVFTSYLHTKSDLCNTTQPNLT